MWTEPKGKPINANGVKGWRLVCHTCGFKWPLNAAANPKPKSGACCRDPYVFIHDTSVPCTFGCADDLGVAA